MLRSLLILSLALICGAAAAVGVNQTLRNQSAESNADTETQTVIVSTQRINRGQKLTSSMVREVEWPATLVPAGTLVSVDKAVGRVALAAILPGEPLFADKLTDSSGKGFIASIVKPGMRAYTIQAKGPSSSVAGFVRPKDRVDVLVNLRGTNTDETGGGSTTTLLQSVEILAIDQILDPDVNTMQMLEMWAKGDNLTSVTLEVTPRQAELLALGQSKGELSLALRNATDEEVVESFPATLNEIRALEFVTSASVESSEDESSAVQPVKRPNKDEIPPPPPTYIHTLRGSQVGRIELTYQAPSQE